MNIINLENIQKKFYDKQIFNDFSLTIDEGDYVAITGRSGKGKTTLLNMMGMLETPDEGDISILGIKNPKFVSNESRNIRRHHLSYLFQNYGLIDNETVMYNLLLSLKFERKSKSQKKKIIANALVQVGLEGYECRKVFSLSGGEQQRVALAKVIAKDSKLILADEPTGSLDEQNRNDILKILEDLNGRGKTIVVVTHDNCVALCAKRVVSL